MDLSTVDDNKYLYTTENLYQNLSLDELAQHAVKSNNFISNNNKALIVDSGQIKGRLPHDKYIVETKNARKNVWWHQDGSDNKGLSTMTWKTLKQLMYNDVKHKSMFVVDGLYNYDEKNSISFRLITTEAAAAYFFKLISITPVYSEEQEFKPQWVIMHSPETKIEKYKELGLNSSKIIATNLKQRESLLLGTHYLAEINKMLLSVSSYYNSLNDIGIFYASVAVDSKAKSSMFFGLSGSGKTTLALDNQKKLLTNQALAWTETRGLYSLKSGLTIKTASFKKEDDRIKAVAKNHLLIENPNFDKNNNIMFGYADGLQDNTYLTFARENLTDNVTNCDNPSVIIFLVKDAKGVLPRVVKLSKGQAIYHFLSGYTSISADIEDGIKDPTPKFSSCYAQSFLLLKPTRYAKILRQRIKNSNPKIYMINVGWIDGDYKTGRRVPIEETKQIVKHLLNKDEDIKFKYIRQKYFNFKYLASIENSNETLHFENNWQNKDEHKKQLKLLAKDFIKNYKQFDGDEFAEKYKKFQPLV